MFTTETRDLASAAASAASTCSDGIEGSPGRAEAIQAIQAISGEVASAFVDAQTCSCGSATSIIQSTVASVAEGALDEVTLEDLTPFAQSAIDTIIVFAQNRCEPGTVDGVLDQDASACVALTSGNATLPGSSSAGSLARTLLACGATGTATVETVAALLGNATSDAIGAAEKACAARPDVQCALSDGLVTNIAIAHVRSFVESYRNSSDTSCSPAQPTDIGSDAVSQMQDVLVSGSLAAHTGICESALASFDDARLPIASELMNAVRQIFTPVDEADTAAGTALPSFSRCGPTSSRDRADLGTCCQTGWHCVAKNAFYAQCRPVNQQPPANWAGDVFAC